CNYQNASFPLFLTKIIPSLSRARAEASFRNNHPAYRYGSATVTSPFISWRSHSRLFFTFLPGCYAGVFMTTPAGLTTSGGTFS
ncbi:TPA: hypothetical protein ACWXQF_004844, partial [Escherichia coli]